MKYISFFFSVRIKLSKASDSRMRILDPARGGGDKREETGEMWGGKMVGKGEGKIGPFILGSLRWLIFIEPKLPLCGKGERGERGGGVSFKRTTKVHTWLFPL